MTVRTGQNLNMAIKQKQLNLEKNCPISIKGFESLIGISLKCHTYRGCDVCGHMTSSLHVKKQIILIGRRKIRKILYY